MTEPFNGLRFDIYERVNLPEQAAAIGELEEIELVPSMQAQAQDDHVLLKGYLLLSGVYRNAEERGVSRLEHRIPVEISLPASRVLQVEDLAVEIDNFDVDLLSSRSLNVTGVLALKGLQAESEPAPIWRDDSFTVVHQAQPAEGAEEGARPDRDAPEWGDMESDSSSTEGNPITEVFPVPWDSDVGWGDLTARNTEADAQETYAEGQAGAGICGEAEGERDDMDAAVAGDAGGFAAASPSGDRPLTSAPEAAADPIPEKPVKVALGGKPLDPSGRDPSGVGLLTLLGEKGAAKEALQQAKRAAPEEEAQEQALAAKTSTGDELEWTRLFLGKESEVQPFRKVRMCIVQREETLDSIAARYNIQPRELQLRNRLSDIYVSEGQVLYIP